MFLEHWNRQKILSNICQCFSCPLDEWIAKRCKKKGAKYYKHFLLLVHIDSLSILSTGTIKLEFSWFSHADLCVHLLLENLSFTCISFLSSSHLNIFCSFSNFKDFPFVSSLIFGIFSLANPFLDSNVRVMLSPLLRFFNVNACSFVKIALVL